MAAVDTEWRLAAAPHQHHRQVQRPEQLQQRQRRNACSSSSQQRWRGCTVSASSSSAQHVACSRSSSISSGSRGDGSSMPARQPAPARPRLPRLAAAAAGGAGAPPAAPADGLQLIEELVDSEMWEAGLDPELDDPSTRQALVAAAAALHGAGVGARAAAAAVLALPWRAVAAAAAAAEAGEAEAEALGDALASKVALYRRWASQEPGAAEALLRALCLAEGGLLAAAELPEERFQAALQFVAGQLPRLGRRRYEALHQPYSLARLVALHPETAAALLLADPRPFMDRAAPWLREQLGWGEAEVAAAALSEWLPQLCALDAGHARRCLAYLCEECGLSRRQAGALLAADLELLAGGDSDLAFRREWAARELAGHPGGGVGSACLAAALCLAQPPRHRTALAAEHTRRLAALLRDVVGMSEEQMLDFVLGGGLEGGATLSAAALERARRRLKLLLLVYGSWPATAAALAATPDVLSVPWQGLEGLLEEGQQRAAWQAVTAMLARQQADKGGASD